jgi:hypothetical protein
VEIDLTVSHYTTSDLSLPASERRVMEKFKVGDRVRSTTTNSDAIVRDIIDERLKLEFVRDKSVGWHDATYFVLNSPPDTVTIGSKTYTKLKSLSPESVYEEGKHKGCAEWQEEFDKYCKVFIGGHGFAGDIRLENVVSKNQYPKWLPWLLAHGYIGVEEKKEKKVVVFDEIYWVRADSGLAYPGGPNTATLRGYVNKPPMKMTLEWSE